MEIEEYGIQEILFWVGVVLFGAAVLPVYLGYLDTGTGSVIASSILVLVTVFYAIQSYRNARYTEKTLDEMRKDRQKHGKTLVIGLGIEPILWDLDKLEAQWERDQYPPLWEIDDVDDSLIRDIEEVYDSFSDDFETYKERHMAYRCDWEDLHQNLREYLNANQTDLPIPEDTWEDNNSWMFGAYATANVPPSGVNFQKDTWGDLRDELIDTRNSVFNNEVDALSEKLEKLIEQHDKLRENLRELNTQYRNEYGLSNIEIGELTQQSHIPPIQMLKGEMSVPLQESEPDRDKPHALRPDLNNSNQVERNYSEH